MNNAREALAAPAQDHVPLSAMQAHRLFPGRTSLYVHEVAAALEISVPHALSLILEDQIKAIEITGKGNKTSREHWRVPVAEFDRFIEARRSDKKGSGR